MSFLEIEKTRLIISEGEQKDFEVYSCHISPDGKRLATAGGGAFLAMLDHYKLFAPISYLL